MLWLIILCVLPAILLFAVLIYYFGAGLGQLKKARLEFKLPGLIEGFVPQGIAFDKCANKFLISGYMSSGQASRIYVVGKQTMQTEKFAVFETQNKTEFKGHAGGIAVYNGYGYISSDCNVYRFKLSELYSASVGEKVHFDFEIKSGNGADFCFIQNGLLWVGEYYKMGKYSTNVTHHILFGENKYHCAVAFAFRLSENGVVNSVPEKALSIPDMVQGMEFCKGRFYISISYGIIKSKILKFENLLLKPATRSIVFKDKRVPLYILQDKFLRKTLTLPPMSEGVCYVDGRLYIVFESASKKYRYFMRSRIKNVFSIKID